MARVDVVDAPKTVASESGIASCSVNWPSSVKSGTSTAPPPIPAADASTVARKMASAQRMSRCCSGHSWRGPAGVGRKRAKQLALQCL